MKMDNIIEVLNSDRWLFVLIVIIPLIAGIAGSIVGYKTIKGNVHESKFKEIKLLLDKAKGGNHNALLEFRTLYKVFKSEEKEKESEAINEKVREMRKAWIDYVRDPNKSQLRLLDTETRNLKVWSVEHLYNIIQPSKGLSFRGEDKIAALNEIAINKYYYFIEYLYNIATSGNSIFLSISAARTISLITDNAPYKPNPSFYISPEESFEHDIPEFKKLREWWSAEGVNRGDYKCPFGEVLKVNRDYYQYHMLNPEEKNIKLEQFKAVLSKYPRLSKTRAVMAYLILGGKESFDEVKTNALKSIKDCETEPLPYLLLAFVAMSERKTDQYQYWIKILKEKVNYNSILESLILYQEKLKRNNFMNSFPYKKSDR